MFFFFLKTKWGEKNNLNTLTLLLIEKNERV